VEDLGLPVFSSILVVEEEEGEGEGELNELVE